MRRSMCVVVVLGGAMVGLTARAQSGSTCTPGVNMFLAYPILQPMQKGAAAFSATVRTTFEQKLLDGNAIHATQEGHVARDSAGRTRTETPLGCQLGEDGRYHPTLSVSVFDPTARTSMSWQAGQMGSGMPELKVVHVFHQMGLAPPPPGTVRKELTPEEQAALAARRKAMTAMVQAQKIDEKREDLGSRSFAGVAATGERITRIIPPGKEGNDLRLEVVTEMWTSKELGITAMNLQDDPRRGRTVAELEEVNLGEPDPALFAVPAGYKVEEIPSKGSGIGAVAGSVMGGVAGSVGP